MSFDTISDQDTVPNTVRSARFVRLPFLPGEDPFNVLVVKEAVEFFSGSVLFLKSGKKRVIGVEV